MERYFEIKGKETNQKVYVELNINENDNYVTVGHFSIGPAPTVYELKSLFKETGLYELGIKLNKGRISPFVLTKKIGMSGCTDWYIKYVFQSGNIKNIHKKHVLHVSMHEKINMGVSGWLGDIVLALAQYPAAREVEIKEVSKDEFFREFSLPQKFNWDEYFKVGYTSLLDRW